MEAPVSPDELIRAWRLATIVASLVAGVELVLLLGAGAVLLAKPISHAIQRHAEGAAAAPAASKAKAKAKVAPAHARRRKHAPVGKPKLTRAKTSVVVLNGNGHNGAAASAAGQLERLGYHVTRTANAHRQDYATSVVLYRRGFRPEAARLARDLRVKVVGPMDGMQLTPSGSQVAVILGA